MKSTYTRSFRFELDCEEVEALEKTKELLLELSSTEYEKYLWQNSNISLEGLVEALDAIIEHDEKNLEIED